MHPHVMYKYIRLFLGIVDVENSNSTELKLIPTSVNRRGRIGGREDSPPFRTLSPLRVMKSYDGC